MTMRPLPTESELLQLELLASECPSGWACQRTAGAYCRVHRCRRAATHLWVGVGGEHTERCDVHPPPQSQPLTLGQPADTP